jgi:hypothetical protein
LNRLRSEVETGLNNGAIMCLIGRRQQVKRMIDEKKIIKKKYFQEIAAKLGLRQIVDKNFDILEAKFFNEKGELMKEKFMQKLYEDEVMLAKGNSKSEPSVRFYLSQPKRILY